MSRKQEKGLGALAILVLLMAACTNPANDGPTASIQARAATTISLP